MDLRRFAWGTTIYGPDLVKQIGRDKLLSAPAHRVEELPWGGAWMQTAENPFLTPTPTKKAIEKHLQLTEVFAGETGLIQHAPTGRLG